MWQSSAEGWVTTALLDAGVGLRDVWETVAGLYERVCTHVESRAELTNRERKIGNSWKRKLALCLLVGSRRSRRFQLPR
jgi:hypothetical protein